MTLRADPVALPPFRPLTDLLREHARARPEHPALVQGRARLNWRELDTLMDRVAAALQRDGLVPGDAVVLAVSLVVEDEVSVGLPVGVAVALASRLLPSLPLSFIISLLHISLYHISVCCTIPNVSSQWCILKNNQQLLPLLMQSSTV